MSDRPTPQKDEKGRFVPGNSGNGGRPKGSRNKLGEAFVAALYDDFQENGVQAIETMRTTDPAAYVRVIASLLPKQVELKEDAFGDLSDDQLAAIIGAARSALGVSGEGGSGSGEEGGSEPARIVPAVH